MELLRIAHADFTLSVECARFGVALAEARQCVGAEHLTSTYFWTDGVQRVERITALGDWVAIAPRDKGAPAMFFDHTDYSLWVEFAPEVTQARFASMLQSDNERFSYHKRHRVLTGIINFGNDIGRSEIKLKYQTEGQARSFTFGFDVLSTKLNYHEHWRSIVADVESEYSMLSLDYLRRTFHGFSPDTEGERPALVWWSVFQSMQKTFLVSVKRIIDRPRHRLRSAAGYQRAELIKRFPNALENELAEHQQEEHRLYRVEEYARSNDTHENRFLKFAIAEIGKKYDALLRRIEELENASATFLKEMRETQRQMQTIARHPFFRSVGSFKGFNQENLVLERAPGYASVYRTWSLLRMAYSLNDGLFRLQSKDIATLYEIWCFIEVSHIVREQLGVPAKSVEHRNRTEMGGLFIRSMERGERSQILFRKDGVALAELVYNPKHTLRDEDATNAGYFVVKTVAQRPDIVLQLVKDDIQRGMKMTYLFDAKYRIEAHRDGVGYPPDDAINQMHRYRDAIYYQQAEGMPLKKEVVGGYILFPGSGEPLDVQAATFYKSIKEVNIGAFPLRPKDKENRALLSAFIGSLLANEGQSLVADCIPQKGLNYVIDSVGCESDWAFVGYVPMPTEESSADYKLYFAQFARNEAPSFYYSGKSISGRIDLRLVRYVFPNIPGNGCYRVMRVYSERRNKLFSDKEELSDRSMRIIFELGEFMPFGTKKIKFSYSGSANTLAIPQSGDFIPLKQLREKYEEITGAREKGEAYS